ncbi:hypothetical protein BABINDRAFT_163497 [Babjeviella inositovora NRRL Y-12698]|uniref:FAR-17a/AIG1-like protein n=1 Tax=Babjeviella inositovora NRRL Y-12698 TaxID=984486 RepID=A0A1E3QKF9_9ASCO|nr:uncharacterized protein BABINDRAFT_163497 [Babjeviella inositovora NRRL Y-12698]ODQ77487.1 hypothetical protein BABINDRAFT_163497 [Babjeviella inositovora NRRL Y-12698]
MRTVGNPTALVLNIVSFLIGAYGFYLLSFVELPPALKSGGQFQFLTNLSLVVSMVYFFLGAVAHITKQQGLFYAKNQVHVVALTLESIVAGVYWPLRFFAVDMIAVEGMIPPVPLDLAIHLMPITSLVLDCWLFMPSWTVSDRVVLRECAVISVGYWYWLEHSLKLATFPYPFLNVPALPRFAIYVVITLFAYANYLLQKQLCNRFIGAQLERTKKAV